MGFCPNFRFFFQIVRLFVKIWKKLRIQTNFQIWKIQKLVNKISWKKNFEQQIKNTEILTTHYYSEAPENSEENLDNSPIYDDHGNPLRVDLGNYAPLYEDQENLEIFFARIKFLTRYFYFQWKMR